MWFLIFPLLLYILFFLTPGVMGIYYSFTDWNVRSMGQVSFVGIDNFVEIFTSSRDYSRGITNTIRFTVVSNIVKIIPALFLAILLQKNLYGKNVYRTILFLPSVLPFLIIGIIFSSIFNFSHGLLNKTLEFLQLGSLQQRWLSDLDVVWKSIYGVDAWQ